MPFDPPGIRVGRLAESLQILKGLFADPPLTFSGAHYRIDDLDSFPRPAQRPHPPILVGAGSPRMLGLAGREADIVGILPKALPGGTISEDIAERSAETMHRKIDWIRNAGSRADQVELSALISVCVADDHRAAAERVAVERGWGAAAADLVLDMPATFVGSADRIGEQMLARRDRFGLSYYVVSDADLDAFAPVVGRLAGR
jgi:alkanesulfonate monooxygenase SsuD/methylene tetrahydromethanopterin reductase-like flavin-dependent oxidoreductase (luciferase family)